MNIWSRFSSYIAISKFLAQVKIKTAMETCALLQVFIYHSLTIVPSYFQVSLLRVPWIESLIFLKSWFYIIIGSDICIRKEGNQLERYSIESKDFVIAIVLYKCYCIESQMSVSILPWSMSEMSKETAKFCISFDITCIPDANKELFRDLIKRFSWLSWFWNNLIQELEHSALGR